MHIGRYAYLIITKRMISGHAVTHCVAAKLFTIPLWIFHRYLELIVSKLS